MAHTYHELHAMTVAQLRDVAKGIDDEALHGFSTMHKEHLLPLVCKALKIEVHQHHDVVGVDKRTIKVKIQELKAARDAAVEAHDHKRLKDVRRRIHSLKRRIHAATH